MTVCRRKNIAGLTSKDLQSLMSDISVSALRDKFLVDTKYYNVDEQSLH